MDLAKKFLSWGDDSGTRNLVQSHHLHKQVSAVVCAYKPSVGEVDTGRSLRPSWLLIYGEFQANEKSCRKGGE